MRRFVLTAALWTATGCPGGGPVSLFDCSEVSEDVEVVLVNGFGDPVDLADVTWSYPDAEDEDGSLNPCVALGGGLYRCEAVGAGSVALRASAEGYEAAVFPVEVTADDTCTLTPDLVSIDMVATDCTEEIRPSVQVVVADTFGDPIGDATVTYEDPAADTWPLPCEEVGGGEYVCGWETTGSFVINASKPCFFDADAQWVEVGSNSCHVITENAAFELEYSCDD